MPITSQQFPSLMNAAADTGVKITEAATEASYKEAFHLKFMRNGEKLNSLSATETDYEPGGPLGQWLEGTALPEQSFSEGYSIKLTTNHFGGAFLLSWPTLKAGKKELINKGPKLLADAQTMTREILGHALLVYGASALSAVPAVGGVPMVNPICGDGLSLFNTGHKWRGNGSITNSNILSTYYHPTQTGVNAVNKLVGRWRQPNNQPMMVMVDSLLVPVEFALLTQVFQQSEKDPLSANNAANVFNKLVPGGVTVDPHLPSASTWYALTNQKGQRPQVRELQAPLVRKIEYNDRFMNAGVALITSFAMGPSVNGWMSVVQVPGSSATVTNSLL